MDNYEKRGYLSSDFRLFHLTDTKKQDFDYHYHDFDKIIIFIKGNVDYIIEGKCYELQPYDIILVNHNDIHRPSIDPSVPYERIIVYLAPGFITSYKTETYDLSDCFRKAKAGHTDVLRIHDLKNSRLFQVISNLEYACSHDAYAKDLYCQVLFLEFMIQLNRSSQNRHLDYLETGSYNQKIVDIMDYINDHLTAELTITSLAAAFYISRYHLMHLFKTETGYTLGSYVNEKRLLLARELLTKDIPITQICFDCGFKNYSTFSRAYKKCLGEAPQDTKKKARSQTLVDRI